MVTMGRVPSYVAVSTLDDAVFALPRSSRAAAAGTDNVTRPLVAGVTVAVNTLPGTSVRQCDSVPPTPPSATAPAANPFTGSDHEKRTCSAAPTDPRSHRLSASRAFTPSCRTQELNFTSVRAVWPNEAEPMKRDMELSCVCIVDTCVHGYTYVEGFGDESASIRRRLLRCHLARGWQVHMPRPRRRVVGVARVVRHAHRERVGSFRQPCAHQHVTPHTPRAVRGRNSLPPRGEETCVAG